MTGASQFRPAAGWVQRRCLELADAAAAGLTPRARPVGVPPRRLRARVGAPGIREFRDGGIDAARELAGALAPRGVGEFSAVLDFGCGCGRVLAPLGELAGRVRSADGAAGTARAVGAAGGVLAGADVDAEAIAWARAHLPGLDLRTSAALPPLPWEAAAFDLVYSISVFSHLAEAAQDAWLAELVRVTRPGGTLLLSTHGPSALEAFRSGRVRTAWCAPGAFARGPLGDRESVSIPYRTSRWSRGDLPGVGDGYGLAFHGPAYVREHWGQFVAVEAIRPQAISGWQDLVVARRRD